jgi:hypothetical protein
VDKTALKEYEEDMKKHIDTCFWCGYMGANLIQTGDGDYGSSGWRIRCPKCKAQSADELTPGSAISSWNQKAKAWKEFKSGIS